MLGLERILLKRETVARERDIVKGRVQGRFEYLRERDHLIV